MWFIKILNKILHFLKLTAFTRNINIYWDMDKKNFFQNDQKNVLLFEMLICSQIWPRNDFFIVITKNVVLAKVLIFSEIGTSNDFQSDLTITWKWFQKNFAFLEVLIFWKYVWAKLIFSKWSQNNDLLIDMLILSKLWPKKRFFYSAH